MTTDELLLRAAARLVHQPTVTLLDSLERLDWLQRGIADPFETYGYSRSDSGWRAAIERAELELEAVLNEQVAAS